MITITKQYRTETGHRLVDYDGKCAHIHGHSYLYELTVGCLAENPALELGDDGMVADFKFVKRAMVAVLEPYDHAFVLCETDPLTKDPNFWELMRATNGESGRVHLWPYNPTAEHMARRFAGEIAHHLPQGIQPIRLRVWETATSYAEWTRRAT